MPKFHFQTGSCVPPILSTLQLIYPILLDVRALVMMYYISMEIKVGNTLEEITLPSIDGAEFYIASVKGKAFSK